MKTVTVLPQDEHNMKLVENVHPANWKNPEPAPRYNLVVIGGGTAGLVTAGGAASIGAKVALVERHLLGGDCLNVGCVPSKLLIRAARAMGEIKRAKDFGIYVPENVHVDFASVMERLRSVRARISVNDGAESLKKQGVDVFLGDGMFTGRHSLKVDGKILHFKKAVIATGARAAHPPIPGLAESGYLTSETVFSLDTLPKRLAVIGGGPIGCELAQSFSRLGSDVTIVEMMPQFLIMEDPDAAKILSETFQLEGIRVLLNTQVLRVSRNQHEKIIYVKTGDSEDRLIVDAVLVGVGRAPNLEGLNLEAAGVEASKSGVTVNDRLQTTNTNIYGAGDVCMKYKFTHAADAAAKLVIQNALFPGRGKVSALTIPWCTYTDPEIAHVGLYEKDAQKSGIEVETFVKHFHDVDRAIIDGDEEGFVKIHVKKGSDKIVGATIVASHAGEMLSELTLAMVGNLGVKTLANVIHPYPTQADAIKKASGEVYRKLLSPFAKNLLKTWLSWTR